MSGGTPSSEEKSFWDGNIPWISSSDIKGNDINNINITRFITEKAVQKSTTKLCLAPVILIVSRVGVGKIAISNVDLCTSQDFCNLVNIKCNPFFLAYRMFTIMKYKSREVQGTSIKGITIKEIQKIKVNIPQVKEEQNKIAFFLSLIDSRITTQNKIINKLQSLIKGLNDYIQDTIEGESVCFSDLGEAYSGLSGKVGDDFGRGKPFVTYMNVYQNTYVSNKEYGLVEISSNERQNRVRYGDALFTLSSETPEEVGMGALYLGSEEELYLNSFSFGIHFNDSHRIHPQYLAYLITSTNFRKSVYPLAQGSTRFNLQKNDFMRMRFSIPKLEKQKKIADTLDSLSSSLAIGIQLHQFYTQQKQHLLCQMFI